MYFAIAHQPLGRVAAPSSSHFFALAPLSPASGSLVWAYARHSWSLIVTHRNYLVTTTDSEAQ